MAEGNLTRRANNFKDLSVLRFGRLTPVSVQSTKPTKWLCRCDCGGEKIIRSDVLLRGDAKSCGCLNSEASAARKRTHGRSATPEYRTWRHMMGRCHSATNRAYAYYGGRGIYVCDRWRESFENFFEDMGARPSGRYSIDRIDNDKGYSKENCRWATASEQTRNQRTNRLITIGGTTKCLAEWCEEFGIRTQTVQSRLRKGWDEAAAIMTPLLR